MKIIELTQGKVTIVDDEDFEYLNQFKWYAMEKRRGDFYALRGRRRSEKGSRQIYMAREIMNNPKGLLVDHRDHNTLDNRKENLRICTKAENCRNQRKQNGCSSVHKGVSWHIRRKKWQGKIKVNGKTIYLGFFVDEDDAARAYNASARKYFGFYACLNVIE